MLGMAPARGNAHEWHPVRVYRAPHGLLSKHDMPFTVSCPGMEDFEAPVPAWVDHDHEPPPAASPASSQGSTPLGFVMSLPTPKASNAGGVFGKLNLPPPKNASPAL